MFYVAHLGFKVLSYYFRVENQLIKFPNFPYSTFFSKNDLSLIWSTHCNPNKGKLTKKLMKNLPSESPLRPRPRTSRELVNNRAWTLKTFNRNIFSLLSGRCSPFPFLLESFLQKEKLRESWRLIFFQTVFTYLGDKWC